MLESPKFNEVFFKISIICTFVSSLFTLLIKPITPATNGLAILVPERNLNLLFLEELNILSPGALIKSFPISPIQ